MRKSTMYHVKEIENKPNTSNCSANPNGSAGGDKHCKQAEVGDPPFTKKLTW